MARDRDASNKSRLPQPIGFSDLRKGDLQRILEIERTCFDQPWSEDSFRDIIARRAFRSLAARASSGQLVGYIIFSEAADELHVLNVAVHPDHRRHKVGSTMLAHLHKHAAERGRSFSFLEVRESNVAAQALYAKFGYKLLTKRKEYYENDRENAIVMVAPLKPRKKG